MEQTWGLQDTKTAGYSLLANSQPTISLVPNRQMNHNLYRVQSNELLLGYSGEESGKVTYLLIRERRAPVYGSNACFYMAAER